MMTNFYLGHMIGWGWGILGLVLTILFWIAVVWFIVWVIRMLAYSTHQNHRPSAALDILKERYAKGEINKDEFEAKKRDIGY